MILDIFYVSIYYISLDNFMPLFYVQPTSTEFKDASDMWELYQDTKNLLFAEAFGDLNENNSTEVKNQIFP